MSQLSQPLNNFWNKQVDNGGVVAKPFSGNCMLCKAKITKEDDDHSVCNKCWNNL